MTKYNNLGRRKNRSAIFVTFAFVVLCFAVGVGLTFTYFSDTDTSNTQTIEFGVLDVTSGSNTWNSGVVGSTSNPLFMPGTTIDASKFSNLTEDAPIISFEHNENSSVPFYIRCKVGFECGNSNGAWNSVAGVSASDLKTAMDSFVNSLQATVTTYSTNNYKWVEVDGYYYLVTYASTNANKVLKGVASNEEVGFVQSLTLPSDIDNVTVGTVHNVQYNQPIKFYVDCEVLQEPHVEGGFDAIKAIFDEKFSD